MTKLRSRIVKTTLSLIGIVAVAGAFSIIGCIASARAAGAVVVGGPGDLPSTVSDARVAMWIAGGTAALAIISTIFHVLRTRIHSAAIATISDSVDALRRIVQPVNIAMVSAADQREPLTKTATPVNVVSGTISIVAALLVIGVAACSGTPNKVTTVGAGLWNCLAPERAQAVEVLTPLAESVIKAAANADGSLIDASKLKAITNKADLTTEAGILLECAMASAVTALLTPTAPVVPSGAAAMTAPRGIDPGALRAAYESIRPPGARFHTAGGDL